MQMLTGNDLRERVEALRVQFYAASEQEAKRLAGEILTVLEPLFRRWIRGYWMPEDLQEELCQQARVDFSRSLQSSREEGKAPIDRLFGYAKRTALRTVLDHLRRADSLRSLQLSVQYLARSERYPVSRWHLLSLWIYGLTAWN